MCRRGSWLQLLLVLAAGLSGFAQEAPRPASVTGEVIDDLTGEPLIRVTVRLIGSTTDKPRRFGALTNAEGKFSIVDLPAGEYTVTAERVGFVTPRDSTRSMRTSLVFRPGEKKTDVKLRLTPVGGITGRVRDSEGEPLESIDVVVENGASGQTAWGQTDDEGRFRIGGLRPGKYRVKARGEGSNLPPEVRTDGSADFYNAPTYYPNSMDERQAGRVDVKAGAETSGVEIAIVRSPIVRVSGTVIGVPPGTRNVSLSLRGGSRGPISASGKFELWRLDPGPLTLRAFWQDPGGQRQVTAPVDLEIGASNIDNIELRAVAVADLIGQVIFEEEQQANPPAQEKPTQETRKPRQLVLTGMAVNSGARNVMIGTDGTFRLERVLPARYRVSISGGAAYVKSMRLGMTEIDGPILDLNNGSGGEPLEVTTSTAFGAVAGIVSDSQGIVPGMTVALTPDSPKSGLLPQLATTDAKGSYSFNATPPGKYRLVAVEEYDIDWASKGKGFDDYKETVVEVEIGAKEKLSKDLKRR